MLADLYYLPVVGLVIGLTIVVLLLRVNCKLSEITNLLKETRDKLPEK